MLVTAFRTALPTMPSPLNRFTANDICPQHKQQQRYRGTKARQTVNRGVSSLMVTTRGKEVTVKLSFRCLRGVGCAELWFGAHKMLRSPLNRVADEPFFARSMYLQEMPVQNGGHCLPL